MLKWIIKISIFILTINSSTAQDSSRLRAGLNAFGGFSKTLDIEIQYATDTDIFIILSGGRQFNAKVEDLLNSEHSKASGNFIRLGNMFLTSSLEKSPLFFLKTELIYSKLEHYALVTFSDAFETFSLPYTDNQTKFGGAIGGGFLFRVSEKFETDLNLMISYVDRSDQYIKSNYSIPGFTYTFFKPAFIFKYKF